MNHNDTLVSFIEPMNSLLQAKPGQVGGKDYPRLARCLVHTFLEYTIRDGAILFEEYRVQAQKLLEDFFGVEVVEKHIPSDALSLQGAGQLFHILESMMTLDVLREKAKSDPAIPVIMAQFDPIVIPQPSLAATRDVYLVYNEAARALYALYQNPSATEYEYEHQVDVIQESLHNKLEDVLGCRGNVFRMCALDFCNTYYGEVMHAKDMFLALLVSRDHALRAVVLHNRQIREEMG